MKKMILLLLLSFPVLYSFSQKKAVTETGEEVILYDNGTWKYAKASSEEGKATIPVNPTTFKKSDDAGFLIKSTRFNIGLWLNSKKWSFKKATDNEDAEYEFQLRDKDLYGMMISEKIEIPLETLKTVALENARSASPDVEIVKQEYRTVNGNKVLMLQLHGSSQGIKFAYCGYYFSNSKGTVQLVLYTAQNLLEEYTTDIEEMLNGLVTTTN